MEFNLLKDKVILRDCHFLESKDNIILGSLCWKILITILKEQTFVQIKINKILKRTASLFQVWHSITYLKLHRENLEINIRNVIY
jgi:hypothetical protein